DLEAARESSPLAPAIGAVLDTLSMLDSDARHVIAIGDAHANLLWVKGDRRAVERAREMQFVPGASWAESAAGTNAVGTATALDLAVQIFSAEHLVAAIHSWTCSAAPIHDPATGALIGVVDITAHLRTAHPHTLSVAALAARAGETVLQLARLEATAKLRELWAAATARLRTASALLDAHGRVIATRGAGGLPTRLELAYPVGGVITLPDGRVGELEPIDGGAILWLCRRRARPRAHRLRLRLLGNDSSAQFQTTRPERALRSLELLAVLAMHPEGLTAEQLALALYGERGKTVTIRAQVHRVRAVLGRGALQTHPYRLLAPIDADWFEVRRLVAAGRPGEALRTYRGPLLPASDAPAIVEARLLLEESLRRSILTTADPDLLGRWLAHPAGAHDLTAARTLVAALPTGDPRRAAATAIASAIAQRLAPATGLVRA
ncbi:MAG: transcriptional regulator, partial [Solirubrobacteraceae bacterium]